MSGLWRERVRGGSATRKKTTVTRPNEDAVLCRAADGLIGVFDGIGMYAEARLASRIARERCAPLLAAIDREKYASTDDALMAVSRAILAAQEGVTALQQQFPYAGEGGTTATVAKLWQASPDALVTALYANIGDSRLYQWYADKKQLERLTTDDSRLRQLREWGEISDSEEDSYTEMMDSFTGGEDLPPLALEAWMERNMICAWLGMPDISFTLGATAMQPGDKLVATSDGIHDNLTLGEIERIISRNIDPREIAINLIDVAQAIADIDESPRAKPDDMAVAVLIFDR
ncbi:MAG TPA: PP2C family protein-serine/threonine phosphatase [Ktedonobacterales bacterium]|nr:PP2C family protein-serine/threonine phosphatase [Ktedonobacterales bacterium]